MADQNPEQDGLLNQDRELESKRQPMKSVVCWILILLIAVAAIVLMVLFIPTRSGQEELFEQIGLCVLDNGGCEHNCSRVNDTVVCSCFDGYTLDGNNKSCSEICTTEANTCEQRCINMGTYFNCSCSDGYQLNADGITCDEIDECATEANDCEQICVDQLASFSCACHEGYQLNDDGKTCDDINECDVDNGGCEQTCENTEGSFICHCGMDFALNADGKTCDDVLYFSDSSVGIYSVALGGEPELLASSEGAYGIDFDCSQRYIFWSSVEEFAILRGRLQDGGLAETQEIVTTGIEMPTDVAVDSFNGVVYWADNEHEHIAAASFDGSSVNTNVISETGRREPLAVALNPIEGKLYWGYQHRLDLANTEYGIEESSLEGQNSTVLVEGLDALTGVKYDQYTDRLCWCDGVSTIECLDLTTSQRHIVTNNGNRPFDMAFTQDSIYWISTEFGDIMALSRDDDSGQGTRFNVNIGSPRGITAGHPCRATKANLLTTL